MDTGPLKRYAIQARRDFLEAVTQRAAKLGITSSGIQDYEKRGDLLFLGTEVLSESFEPALKQLRAEVSLFGFEQTIDQIAYTWFNRLIALRFMEVNGLLPIRVLSSTTENPYPDVLRGFAKLSLAINFNPQHAHSLYEAGGKDEELYRYLLIAHCNELYRAMPFLFEIVSDSSEMLLPDGLLSSDSIIRKLVENIEEESWLNGVEIIGWLYQFYISEKKDEVIGSVVKSQDIPAATQLFTPNWIVKYLVQNSLGAYWLGTNPDSPLRKKMEFYIEPAKQTPEVEAELKRITPKDIDPETITVLDPAVGSGHILVEAYNLLYDIYLERGYRAVDVPRLILEKNLYGLDIDKRASQLAGFALVMRAAKDDSTILDPETPPKLNVVEIVEPEFKTDEAVQFLMKGKSVKIQQLSMPFAKSAAQIAFQLESPDELTPDNLAEFIDSFRDAKTYGSLIQVPGHLVSKFSGIEMVVREGLRSRDIFERRYAEKILRLVEQARILSSKFDVVVANPPYMATKYQSLVLKNFIKKNFQGSDKDLFSSFFVRCLLLSKDGGRLGFMSPFVWMFISSYEDLRTYLLKCSSIHSLIQLEYSGFDGATVPICTFTLINLTHIDFNGGYIRLSDFRGAENQAPRALEAIQNRACGWFFTARHSDFSSIPGSPIAYWISDRLRQVFREGISLGDIAEPRQGMATTNNALFLRRWYEVEFEKIGLSISSAEEALSSGKKWFPYNKGGGFRKWFGNLDFVVNFEKNGKTICDYIDNTPGVNVKSNGRVINRDCYFKPSITWTFISSSKFGVRFSDTGFIFDVAGSSIFPSAELLPTILGFMLSKITWECLRAQNPTLNFQVGNIATLPVIEEVFTDLASRSSELSRQAIEIARDDWNSSETSWGFSLHPLLSLPNKKLTIQNSYIAFDEHCLYQIEQMRALEIENNRLFIDGYGLKGELSPDVSESEITLRRPNLLEDIESLISYAVGCMIGRYSLDKMGIAYADSSGLNFDASLYQSFPADSDGIIPILDYPWFKDDAATRFSEFLKQSWGENTLQVNLSFVASSLGPRSDERPEETIRRYFSDSFFKQHLKTYSKRPIYWLFKSGKEQAFQCLVYLHRYNETTLSTMRTEYVLPLQAKMATEDKRLENDIELASSVPEKNRLRKQLQQLHKQQAELRQFDEKLHHYADQRIRIDLDDGVKVNYGKFGDLLSDVKAITGGAEE